MYRADKSTVHGKQREHLHHRRRLNMEHLSTLNKLFREYDWLVGVKYSAATNSYIVFVTKGSTSTVELLIEKKVNKAHLNISVTIQRSIATNPCNMGQILERLEINLDVEEELIEELEPPNE
jgi:hypothetical protein